MARTGVRMLRLTHGHIASHQGDLPLTAEGRRQAERAGIGLARSAIGSIAVSLVRPGAPAIRPMFWPPRSAL